MNEIREVGWWRWPLWSWRNLAVTIIAAALLVAGVGRLSDGGTTEARNTEPTAAATESGAARAPTPAYGSRNSSASPTSSTTLATPEAVEDVAVAFVRIWARPDSAVEEWRKGCQALSTQRFASLLDVAYSATVPVSRVVGDPEVLRWDADSASVRVPTDGGAVHVALRLRPAGWRVDGIEPEELSAIRSASGG